MTVKQLDRMTTDQLAERFLALALAKGDAIMGDENAKANRIYWKIDAILKELKARAGDQRRVLAALYDHRDPSVRLEAATATLAIFPETARKVLQWICDRKEFPFAGDAGSKLDSLRTGFYKPT